MSPEVAAFVAANGVDLICKDKSWSMKLFSILLWPMLRGRFMTDFWTTVRFPLCRGFIAYPVGMSESEAMSSRNKQVRTHELFHVAQQRGPWGLTKTYFLYFIFPLPIFWSGRWLLEREPFLSDIKARPASVELSVTIDRAVDTLWFNYFYPWFRPKMKKWFQEQLGF